MEHYSTKAFLTVCLISLLVTLSYCGKTGNEALERRLQIYKEQNLSPVDVSCASVYQNNSAQTAICIAYFNSKTGIK